ncbi:hypothetical protein PR202_gb23711 [Eleusine coracana subsp. coracana]|uniref:Uncharacterized protein n=1 Tax=Eleusine coracana subsp. coracana TaxID=191504 RepID=A0AAV5FIY1_ELECO|nr:hypothetical protein PR202_gb23711 [Eleusine coracana subsp. coracana]
MAPPIIFLAPDIAATSGGSPLNAALHGNLGRLKGIVKNLGMGPAGVLAVIIDGFGGVLHCAAAHGHLEVCKYLVEELGGVTPFMLSAHSDDVCTVKYLLDHAGSCKVTEFLLSQGIPVDIDCGRGTPLFQAAGTGEDKTLKILLDHNANAGADVNGKGPSVSPLLFATGQGKKLRCCCHRFPYSNVPNWSVDGVISYAQFKKTQPVDKEPFDKRMAIFQSQADNTFRQKKYAQAAEDYSLAGYNKPNATLYSNQSLCKLKMGDGEGALSDAKQCRMIQPGWAKACYRQGAAHMLLKPQRAHIFNVQEYKQACEAFQDAEKQDPGNEEIERELR